MITEHDIRDIISEKIIGVDQNDIDIETTFSDAGIDSLDFAVILLTLDEKFGLVIPDEDSDKCNSIKNILEYAKDKL